MTTFTCPKCNMTSFHPEDKAQGYCGNCHEFTGAVEPPWGGQFTADGGIQWEAPDLRLGPEPKRPHSYYPDGEPILDDELMPAWLKWAMLFETAKEERVVGKATTLYGENLSTVWLGLDHNFGGDGPPIIYETMLFAPCDPEADREYITTFAGKAMTPEKEAAYNERKAHTERYFPHDQLQLRYSTRGEALKMHRRLRLHCLIPPRWRAYLLGELAGITTWRLNARPEEDD